MAESSKSTKTAKLALRQAINDAYAFCLATEFNKGIGTVTFDMLLQEEYIRLKEGTTAKLSVQKRLEALETRVLDAIDKAKATDPHEFSTMSTDEQANTEEESED